MMPGGSCSSALFAMPRNPAGFSSYTLLLYHKLPLAFYLYIAALLLTPPTFAPLYNVDHQWSAPAFHPVQCCYTVHAAMMQHSSQNPDPVEGIIYYNLFVCPLCGGQV
jgi:hypothetical protein